jgi:hypothetical protein
MLGLAAPAPTSALLRDASGRIDPLVRDYVRHPPSGPWTLVKEKRSRVQIVFTYCGAAALHSCIAASRTQD